MRITRSTSRKVNDNNYGHGEFFVSVALTHNDLGYSDEEWLAFVQKNGTQVAIDTVTDKVTTEMEKAVSEEAEALLALMERVRTD